MIGLIPDFTTPIRTYNEVKLNFGHFSHPSRKIGDLILLTRAFKLVDFKDNRHQKYICTCGSDIILRQQGGKRFAKEILR